MFGPFRADAKRNLRSGFDNVPVKDLESRVSPYGWPFPVTVCWQADTGVQGGRRVQPWCHQSKVGMGPRARAGWLEM